MMFPVLRATKFSCHKVNFDPIDDAESDRHRIVHQVLQAVFDNRLLFPPLTRPRRVLDCGTNWLRSQSIQSNGLPLTTSRLWQRGLGHRRLVLSMFDVLLQTSAMLMLCSCRTVSTMRSTHSFSPLYSQIKLDSTIEQQRLQTSGIKEYRDDRLRFPRS